MSTPIYFLVSSIALHVLFATPSRSKCAGCPSQRKTCIGSQNCTANCAVPADDEQVEEFKICISDEQINDLKQRLDLEVIPPIVPRLGVRNEIGIEPDDLRTVIDYWKNQYQWRDVESKLNSIPQFTTLIDGVKIHFLHIKADRSRYGKSGKPVTPLLLIHGWPQTAFDYQHVIPYLTDPLLHGRGSESDAFDVVVPSMPGYAFSGQPIAPHFGARQIAVIYAKLMRRLGYPRYLVNGGDWGSIIAPHLVAHEEEIAKLSGYRCRVLGLHLNGVVALPISLYKGNSLFSNIVNSLCSLATLAFPHLFYDNYDRQKMAYMQRIPYEMSYFLQQMTKPLTLGISLANSPVAVAVWITEKFISWTDCSRSAVAERKADRLEDKLNPSLRCLSHSVPLSDLVTVISIYWFTNTITSSVMMYHNTIHHFEVVVNELAQLSIQTPTAIADFPVDIIWSPLRWAKGIYSNIIQYKRFPKGGHFACLEEPELFAKDLRQFKASVV